MANLSADRLVILLRQPILRARSGVVLLDSAALGQERNLAARLGIESVDLQAWKLCRVGQSRFLGLSACQLLGDLDAIVDDRSIPGNCVMVYNLDVFLSGLSDKERGKFWRSLFTSFIGARGLVVCLPERAANVFSKAERERWISSQRLAVFAKG